MESTVANTFELLWPYESAAVKPPYSIVRIMSTKIQLSASLIIELVVFWPIRLWLAACEPPARELAPLSLKAWPVYPSFVE